MLMDRPRPAHGAHIDLTRLRRDIAELARATKETKRALRVRWTRPMADEQRALCRLRRRATELHVLLAHVRGRLHVAAPTSDATPGEALAAWHTRVAERVARDYTPSPEAARTA